MSGKLYLEDDRLKMAIFKSCRSIREMIELRTQYYELSQSNIHNMSDKELREFKNNLDKIKNKSFYNIDVYYKELSFLCSYLENNILIKEDIFE